MEDRAPSRKRQRASGSGEASASRKRGRREEPRSWGGERESALQHRHGNWDARGVASVPRWGDARLDGASPAWFSRASVLDVGCGAGYTALAVAERWGAASVLGVDVDAGLVAVARRNLLERRRELRMAELAGATVTPPVPLSLRVIQRVPPTALAAAQAPRAALLAAAASPSALDVVSFRHEDCVGDSTLGHAPGAYSVVLCLAVTKWVHLNSGDRGLLTLFRRLHSYLQPGGRLLLGMQPWSSYRGASRGSADLRATYESIRLRPDGFADFLLQRVGFHSLETTLEYRKASGATRQILVLVK